MIVAGSSPLTRGKPRFLAQVFGRGGLIPAHAGKTPPPTSRSRPRRAHPRSRGENAYSGTALTDEEGSSPLTRGKRVEHLLVPVPRGLIPAHAGKTPSSGDGVTWRRAHPRSRGENFREGNTRSQFVGSSPLTRGKRPRRGRGWAVLGLIPAHAGKTLSHVTK